MNCPVCGATLHLNYHPYGKHEYWCVYCGWDSTKEKK